MIMLKNKFKTIVVIIFIIGCNNDNSNLDQVNSLITPNINTASVFYSFDNWVADTAKTWDIKFSNSSNGFYNLELNSSAGVMGIKSDINNFSDVILPDSGLSYDNFLIGSSWVDSSTYNLNDGHSLQSKGNTYFIWTTDYNFVKIQVTSAKTVVPRTEYQIIFKYQILNQEENIITETINYFSDDPYYFNINSRSKINPLQWDIGFSLTPVFSSELNTYQNMPTVLLSMDSDIRVSVFENFTFEQTIDTTSTEWLEDSINQRHLGYGGEYQVIWYHPEPPYNHKAIIEYTNRIYILSNSNSLIKLQFNEYDSGYLGFVYNSIY